MIKLFTDLQNFPPPFIPKMVEYNEERYTYVDSASDCDYVVLPYWEVLYEYSDGQYRNHKLDPAIRPKVIESTNRLIEEAKKYNKKLIVFHFSDDERDVPVENSIIIKTSLYKSRQKDGVFALPSWHGDLIKENGRETTFVRKKGELPSVGFRGSSRPLSPTPFDMYRYNMIFINKILTGMKISFLKKHEWNPGQVLRKKAMITLMKNKHVKSDFQVLLRGWINQNNPQQRIINRNMFIDNIFGNDYILCVRGAGNYSYRFYETLSAGRIPLFINTDCVLPYDFIIDWKKYVVWVEEADVNKIDQILLDFHNDLSNDDFEELQLNIRRIWDEWISPTAFFNRFEHHFDAKKAAASIQV